MFLQKTLKILVSHSSNSCTLFFTFCIAFINVFDIILLVFCPLFALQTGKTFPRSHLAQVFSTPDKGWDEDGATHLALLPPVCNYGKSYMKNPLILCTEFWLNTKHRYSEILASQFYFLVTPSILTHRSTPLQPVIYHFDEKLFQLPRGFLTCKTVSILQLSSGAFRNFFQGSHEET